MKTILKLSLFFILISNASISMAAFGCRPDICDPANSCLEGCPGYERKKSIILSLIDETGTQTLKCNNISPVDTEEALEITCEFNQ